MTTQRHLERGADRDAAVETRKGAPANTGSTTTRVLGIVALVGSALLVYLALVGTPADVVQNDAVRLLYVHVPVVVTAYVACLTAAAASVMWLWKRTQWWDLVAASAAELGALFIAGTLVTGSIWGGAAWGTFWTWDARLTSTALLFLVLLGYLAVRRIPATSEVRGRRSAIVALLFVPNMILTKYSVEWWRSLHQGSTVLDPTRSPKIQDLQAFTLLYAMALGGVVFAWLIIHRFRVAYLQDQVDELGLTHAIEQRRAEAQP